MISLGHNHVSTWGIGQHMSADEWKSVMRQLVARGYLDVDPDGFGGLRLNDSCRGLLRGEENVRMRRETRSSPGTQHRKAALEIAPEDQGLWYALRACRKSLAEAQGVPPYVIFHDATLREMLDYRPTTDRELLALTGVGDSKLQRFGEAFLAVIRDYEYADE